MYEVIVIKEGYCQPEAEGCMKAGGTITLLKGPFNIMVDTGSPWDKEIIMKGLSSKNLTPEDIQYVICSHGHSDHIGNLNLFTNALHVVGFDICRRDQYYLHDFTKGIPYEIDEDVEIWPTPGHTGQDVSVIVRNTLHGTVGIVGDLFECEADIECPSLWQDNSLQPSLQEKCRLNILKEVDCIVPGHGAMFKVDKKYRQHNRKIIMMTEECEGPLVYSKTECIIVEDVGEGS